MNTQLEEPGGSAGTLSMDSDTPERARIGPDDGPESVGALTRAWLDEHLPADWGRAPTGGSLPARAGAPDDDAYRAWYPTVAFSGLITPGWPTDAFGLGLEPAQCDAVSQALTAVGIERLGELDLYRAGPTIIQWGTHEQRAKYLPGILTATEAWTELFSEPGAGSDLPSLATSAIRDGDEWVLSGQKVWSSFAGWSKYGMLLARTDRDAPKRQGITYFLIDLDQPGVDIRPLVQMTGDAEFFEVFLDEARVADADRLGPMGQGWDVARTTMSGARRPRDGSVAEADRSLERLIDHHRDDGGRIGDPVLRQRLAELYVQRMVNALTMQRLEVQADAATLHSAIGKLAATAYNTSLTTAWIDLAGAHGTACDAEDEVRLQARDEFLGHPARRIYGGSDEIQRNTMGENVLGLAREPDPYHGKPWSEVPRS